jgi:predicted peptidase
MRKFIILLSVVIAISHLQAQDLSLYQKNLFISEADTMPYRLLLPEGYNPAQQYPLLLFLHGAGERGNDNQKQLTHGASLFVRADIRNDFPCIVLAPQCSASDYWSNVIITTDTATRKRSFNFQIAGEPTQAMATVIKLLQEVINNYSVDINRIYTGGISMGGMGTFEVVLRNPDIFAAAFPLCGGANPATAKDMRNTAWWIFHGAKDDVVLPSHSQNMLNALQTEGASVGFTLYPHANHNCWDAAFAEPDLLKWLFKQQKK